MRLLPLLATLVAVHFATAQTNTTGSGGIPKTMATMRPKVAFLVGSYRSTSSMPSSPVMPKGATGSGTTVISWALDSTYLQIDDRSVNSLFGNFLNFGMLGFDSPSGKFFLSMYNNYGDHPHYQGTFAGDTLVFHATIPSPRGTFEQQVRWTRENDGLRLQILNDRGKGYQLTLDEVSTPAGAAK